MITYLTSGEAGPTLFRMLVGSEPPRRLRQAAEISRAKAGYAIQASDTKIQPSGAQAHGFKPRDVADLLTLYGVTGDAERQTLLTMAEHANTPGWWHAYSDVVPSWFEAYIGLEQAATVIRTWEVQFVPRLVADRGLRARRHPARARRHRGRGRAPRRACG